MPNSRRILADLLHDDPPIAPAADDLRTWEHLLVRAKDEGLCGLLLNRICQRHIDCPPHFPQLLNVQRDFVDRANRERLKHVAHIARSAEQAGIELMLLKGAALVLDLYDDPGLRPMCDIDWLIRPESAASFDKLLRDTGYKRGQNLLRKDFYPRFHYEAEYLQTGPRPVRLDVHVRPFRPLRYHALISDDLFWNETVTVTNTVAGDRQPVVLPSPTLMLVHLACHASFHGADRLLWLFDIKSHATAKADQIDWDYLNHILRHTHLTHSAHVAFCAAESAFGEFLPSAARDALNSAPVSIVDRVSLWQSPRDKDHPFTRTVVETLCTPGWRLPLGYLRAVLLPDQQHLAESYDGRHFGWHAAAHVQRVSRRFRRGRHPSIRGDEPFAVAPKKQPSFH
jgi:Uncharacterised nucleotidyltransferase